MVRQDSGVQHVRIGEDYVPAFADRFARVAGRIAVVGKNSEAVIQTRSQIVQFGQLVLRQRLGREQVQRARIGIFQNGVQDWQVVAQRLARGRRRHHHEILARPRHLRRGSLMRVKLLDFLGAIRGDQLRAHPRRHGPVDRLAGREVLHGGEDFIGAITRRQGHQRVLHRIQRRAAPHRQASLRSSRHLAPVHPGRISQSRIRRRHNPPAPKWAKLPPIPAVRLLFAEANTPHQIQQSQIRTCF